ncbi:hypothetical protein Q3G72_028789 [Acer saccharum]|nr:hypothetical protein Q3G72_028789 [Acer saccharum]
MIKIHSCSGRARHLLTHQKIIFTLLVDEGVIQKHISVFRKFDKVWVPITSTAETLHTTVQIQPTNVTAILGRTIISGYYWRLKGDARVGKKPRVLVHGSDEDEDMEEDMHTKVFEPKGPPPFYQGMLV